MENLANVAPTQVVTRLFHMAILSFIFLYAVVKVIGPENKAKWFKKRKKYTFFNRRGIFGEDINFGYPVTWQGCVVFCIINGFIFGVGYWYIFLLSY